MLQPGRVCGDSRFVQTTFTVYEPGGPDEARTDKARRWICDEANSGSSAKLPDGGASCSQHRTTGSILSLIWPANPALPQPAYMQPMSKFHIQMYTHIYTHTHIYIYMQKSPNNRPFVSGHDGLRTLPGCQTSMSLDVSSQDCVLQEGGCGYLRPLDDPHISAASFSAVGAL